MSKPDIAARSTRELYDVAAQWFPAAIANTTIPDLQRSAIHQIVGGKKDARVWARQNGVSEKFAYALIIAHLQGQLEADDRERASRKAMGRATGRMAMAVSA